MIAAIRLVGNAISLVQCVAITAKISPLMSIL